MTKKGRKKFWRTKMENFVGKGHIVKIFHGVRKKFRK